MDAEEIQRRRQQILDDFLERRKAMEEQIDKHLAQRMALELRMLIALFLVALLGTASILVIRSLT
jgi:CHASE3 domain sensor protein